MNAFRTLGFALTLVLLSSDLAIAWLRPRYEDATVVGRSELIVVGRLVAGSIKYVPHARKPDRGRSGEHHANLVISEVYYSLCALKAFKDPRAKGVITKTRDRWRAISFDNSQIVEECEIALQELSAIEKNTQHIRINSGN